MSKRLTSADIEDGKVEFDPATNSKITYKKIDKGYQMHIVTPQPNGTNKTQTKTFFDPEPVELDKDGKPNMITSADIEDGKVEFDPATNSTITYKKIKNGYKMHIVTPQPNGTSKTQTKTFYDPRPVGEDVDYEEDDGDDEDDIYKTTTNSGCKKTTAINTGQVIDSTQIKNVAEKEKKVSTKKQSQGQMVPAQTSSKKVNELHAKTQEMSVNSEECLEETRRVTKKTEVTGRSTTTTNKNSAIEENISTERKKKSKCDVPVPPDYNEPPSKKVAVVKNKVPGGTEYIYTTILTDGRIQTIIKTVYERVEIKTIEEETQIITSEPITKKIIPSENSDDVTTLETIKISNAVQYRYTTVSKDGTAKRTIETFYDPVPIETSDDEEVETSLTNKTKQTISKTDQNKTIITNSPLEDIERIPQRNPDGTPQRLTSADIIDGKVEYDEITKTTTTYKKIENGYTIHIVIPQPNGTNRTETKTFYDPVPVPSLEDDEVENDIIDTKTTTRPSIAQTDNIPRTNPDGTPRRLTSTDIIDGKVEYDEVTKTTTTYKKIEKGYQMTIVTPQPNGTNKTEKRTFYDPVPDTAVPGEEDEPETTTISEVDIDKTTKIKKIDDNTTVVTRRIPNGREEVTTTKHPDGTQSVVTRTFYDTEITEITDTTHIQEVYPEKKTTKPKQDQPNEPSKPLVPVEETEIDKINKHTTEATKKTTKNISETSSITTRSPNEGTDNVPRTSPDGTPRRLTSVDIVDGKVEYDEVTKTTTTYKKIEKGYQMTIVTPQPNGTNKTEIRTFYDPVPQTVPIDEDEPETKTSAISNIETDKTTKIKKIDDNTTVVTRRIPNGREEVTTKKHPDGSQSVVTRTFYDTEITEITDTTHIEEVRPGQKKVTQITTTTHQDQSPTGKMISTQSILQKTNNEQKNLRRQVTSQQTFEEVRCVTKKSQVSGQSTSMLREGKSFEENVVTNRKTENRLDASRSSDVGRANSKTTVVANKVPGGTEYIYTTILADGSVQTTIKAVYEKVEVQIFEQETAYHSKNSRNEKRQRQLVSTASETKKIGSNVLGDVTTVETKKIPGGIQYHYKTITTDGLVKRTMETFYDPVPVEGQNESDDE